MPNCPHGNYIKDIEDTTSCSLCNTENYKKRKFVKKSESIKLKSKFKNIPKDEKTKNRDKLKTKLQALHSKKMKELYKEMGVYYCWITGKSTLTKGLFSLHVSHYYPKGDIWQLWTDPINSGLSTYNENVNKPQTVTQMRRMMIKVWGIDKVNELDIRADEYSARIKMGIDPKYPTDLWLMGKISELKSKAK